MARGGARPGAGRPKGAKDKVQRTVKDNILAVFENLGGVEAMTEWAKESRRDFYLLYGKLLPKQIEGDIRHTHEGLAQELPDDELARIASAGSAGAAKEKGGASKSTELH